MMEKDIAMSAGDIYTLLCSEGRITLRKIMELSSNKEKFSLALGWLLRDNKVIIFQDCTDWYIEKKEVYSEMYF